MPSKGVTRTDDAPHNLQTNINSETSSRASADTALGARVGKLEGNITAADLEGTYNFYFVATAIDGGPNTITTHFYKGTVTLGTGGTGQSDPSASGRQLTEPAPTLYWLATYVGDAQVGNYRRARWRGSDTPKRSRNQTAVARRTSLVSRRNPSAASGHPIGGRTVGIARVSLQSRSST